NDLQTLASTSPFVNGDAVYTARAIVGYTEPVVIPKNLENDDNNSSDITVKIYPNPAENNINVELSGIATRQFRFVIRNILGVKLLEKQIGGNESLISIDISNLNNGLYLYEIINIKGLNIKNGRLVISK
ncbi:MAG TPA: T9SS type A sorting domain-containing protein, partial [Bacteroidales bacterium]|nr:T9SS type A sorting domain-containing protein [Bacteroidales bacterium]